jgi:predicted Fe-Mo cluster-binding NifX family protein
MKICMPIDQDRGLQSPVCAHFGSAPLFLLVDTETGTCRAIANQNQHHGHGMCAPLASLQGEAIDGMVVGGIGGGALNKLRAAGIRVYLSTEPTAKATLTALGAGTLREVMPGDACAHPGHGHEGQGHHGHGAGHGWGGGRS